MLFADAISDNNFLQPPFIAHDINIQAIHTHLLKWPVALLENAVGFNFHTHAVVSFILLLVMNAGLVYLFYLFSNRNKFITAVCLLLLTSVELMTGISANEGTLTMITIRNLELPITIGAILALVQAKRTFSVKFFIAIFALAIIFVTDQLLLFTSIIGVILYAVFTIARNGAQPSLAFKQDKALYLGILLSAVASKIITSIVNITGIANFYSMQNTTDKLAFIGSFKGLFESTLDNIGKIFDVYGAGFFGQQLEYGPAYLVNIGLLLATTFLAVKLFKRNSKQNEDSLNRTLIALFCMYFFAMLVFTVLIPRELAGRYFAFLPILGIFLIAKKYNKTKISLRSGRSKYIFVGCIIATIVLFAVMAVIANRIYYKPKYATLSSSLGDTSAVVNILEKENTTVYLTMDTYERGYWTGQVIKQQYDEKTHKQLAIGSVFCDNFIIDRQFTRKSWVVASGQRVAVHVKGCNLDKIKQRLGQPTTSYGISKGNQILIYKEDIRNKLRTDQFDTNRFVK
jgi:hypothetical protein